MNFSPKKRDESAPKVNLDLISKLYNQKVNNGESQILKTKKSQIGDILDEYDPARPNDYEQVLKNRRKKKKIDYETLMLKDVVPVNKL